jgi:hypothetical protein
VGDSALRVPVADPADEIVLADSSSSTSRSEGAVRDARWRTFFRALAVTNWRMPLMVFWLEESRWKRVTKNTDLQIGSYAI